MITTRSGSVIPAMICHVANNTVSVLLSATLGTPQGRGFNTVLLGVTAAVFVASLQFLPPPEPAGAA